MFKKLFESVNIQILFIDLDTASSADFLVYLIFYNLKIPEIFWFKKVSWIILCACYGSTLQTGWKKRNKLKTL